MKKRLLFVLDTMPLGGIAKSILSLFNALGDCYEIDLLLFRQEGFFVSSLPANVNLLPEPIEIEFRKPSPLNIIYFILVLPWKRFLRWVEFSWHCTICRLEDGFPGQMQYMELYFTKHAKSLEQQYDAAIGYQGGKCIYYILDKVQASVKIGYVHNDYTKSKFDYMIKPCDERYFPKLDYLVTISPECAFSLKQEFPMLAGKIRVVENICSPSMIRQMADTGVGFQDGYTGTKILTMGRVDIETKGLDWCVQVCRILVDKGYGFKWYILGDGPQREQFEKMIADAKLKRHFCLLGAYANPYPFIKQCDVYVQPSRYEGKSIALDEVKALAKPIVVTNFTTAHDQFSSGVNALIAEMKPESIAEAIMKLLDSKKLRDELTKHLRQEKVGNEEQVNRFIDLIESREGAHQNA